MEEEVAAEPRRCSRPGCDGLAKAKDLCWMHYVRMRRIERGLAFPESLDAPNRRKSPLVPIQTRVTARAVEKLRGLAKARRSSISDAARVVIEKWEQEQEQQAPEGGGS